MSDDSSRFNVEVGFNVPEPEAAALAANLHMQRRHKGSDVYAFAIDGGVSMLVAVEGAETLADVFAIGLSKAEAAILPVLAEVDTWYDTRPWSIRVVDIARLEDNLSWQPHLVDAEDDGLEAA